MKFNPIPQNVCALFAGECTANPAETLYFSTAHGSSTWNKTIRSDALKRVAQISLFLQNLGITKGTSVAIISSTRPEWLETDLGIMGAGGVVVSVYPSLPPADIGYILFDSHCETIFVENEEQLQKIHRLLENEISIPASEDRAARKVQLKVKAVITFEKTSHHPYVHAFSSILASPPVKEPWPLVELTGADVASLVYTSGTTGPQKGVIQTHGNHLANIRQSFEGRLFGEGHSIFLLLPLAHSFAKLLGYIGACMTVPLWFAAVADTQSSKLNQIQLLADLKRSSATIVPLVPRILEKMSEAILHKASRSRLIQATLDNATRRADGSQSASVKLGWLLLAPIRNAIRKKLFGNKFAYAISGGAKLSASGERLLR